MEPDGYIRIIAQLNVLEEVISSLVRGASLQTKLDIREKLLAIAGSDRVDLSAYGEAQVSTANRLLNTTNLYRG